MRYQQQISGSSVWRVAQRHLVDRPTYCWKRGALQSGTGLPVVLCFLIHKGLCAADPTDLSEFQDPPFQKLIAVPLKVDLPNLRALWLPSHAFQNVPDVPKQNPTHGLIFFV